MRMVENADEDDHDELDTDDHTDVTFEESLLELVDDTLKLHINVIIMIHHINVITINIIIMILLINIITIIVIIIILSS